MCEGLNEQPAPAGDIPSPYRDATDAKRGLEDLSESLAVALVLGDSKVPNSIAEFETDDAVDLLIALSVLDTGAAALAEKIKAAKNAASAILAERFVELGQQSVTRKKKTVYLTTEYWPGPAFEDLLPPGINPNDPAYAATVARCRVAAKDRLIEALKSDPELSDLVEETYNAQSLRGAIAGEEAERDELDVPIIPESLWIEAPGKDPVPLIKLNPKVLTRVRKAGK